MKILSFLKRKPRQQKIVIAHALDIDSVAILKNKGIQVTPYGLDASILLTALHYESSKNLSEEYESGRSSRGLEFCTFDDNWWVHGNFVANTKSFGVSNRFIDSHQYRLDASRTEIEATIMTSQNLDYVRARLHETVAILHNSQGSTEIHESPPVPPELPRRIGEYSSLSRSFRLNNPILVKVPELFFLYTGARLLEMYRLIGAGRNNESDKPNFSLWFDSNQEFTIKHRQVHQMISVARGFLDLVNGSVIFSYIGIINTKDNPKCHYDYVDARVREFFLPH